MQIGWNFPLNNDGAEVGLNDAGIETFRGKRLEALAREICQNSCDERKDQKKPVRVDFNLEKLNVDMFPGIADYKNIFESGKDYWKGNQKTVDFFEKGLSVLNEQSISVLKISDYNTTGLTGSQLERGSKWHSLIKAVGVSNKSSNAGGSFGIGKHAPFACSNLRTVFYGTNDEEGVKAFQGVGKLATHLKNNQATQGTGYFGTIDKNRPVFREYEEMIDFFRRDKVGTDIFVMGFNGGENWESEIIKSVLESFFYAIHEKRLVVTVGDIEINHETIERLLETFIKEDKDHLSYKYYKALKEGKYFEVDIKNFDKVALYLLENKDMPKRVAMVRGTGMKIFDKGHFRGLTKFIGVMVAKGPKINKMLRLIEPPSHDVWQPERYEENVALAKKVLKELYSWINEKIRDISSLGEVEELDIEGISQYLPDDDEVSPFEQHEENGEGTEKPKEIVIEKVPVKKPDSAKVLTAVGPIDRLEEQVDDNGDYEDEEEQEKRKREKNKKDNKDKKPTPKPGDSNGGESHGEGQNNNVDTKNPTGNEDAKPPLQLNGIRSFCINPKEGIYQVTYTPNRDGEGYLVVNIVGEQGQEEVKILSANNVNKQKLNIKSKNQIGPVLFSKGIREKITLKLEDGMRYALGVAIYEN